MTPGTYDEQNPNPQLTNNSFRLSNISTNIKPNPIGGSKDQSPNIVGQQRSLTKPGLGSHNGPIKATANMRDGRDMNTINFDEKSNYPYSEQNGS